MQRAYVDVVNSCQKLTRHTIETLTDFGAAYGTAPCVTERALQAKKYVWYTASKILWEGTFAIEDKERAPKGERPIWQSHPGTDAPGICLASAHPQAYFEVHVENCEVHANSDMEQRSMPLVYSESPPLPDGRGGSLTQVKTAYLFRGWDSPAEAASGLSPSVFRHIWTR